MRQFSAILAILAALIGAAQLLLGRGDTFALTTAIYTIALLVSAILALRGAPLIYLAASWGIYLGTTSAAYLDVEVTFLGKSDPVAVFGGLALVVLIIVEFVGLISSILAYRKEARL
jgi:hypothetical protein